MDTPIADHAKFLQDVAENKARASHWRDVHFDCARHYELMDRLLGLPSVALATAILGFAWYAVDRPNAPLWTQYTLATLAVLQGVLSSVHMYWRPSVLSERYRVSATNFGSMVRKWNAIEQRAALGVLPTLEDLNEVFSAVDQAVREALPAAGAIKRRMGLGPKRP